MWVNKNFILSFGNLLLCGNYIPNQNDCMQYVKGISVNISFIRISIIINIFLLCLERTSMKKKYILIVWLSLKDQL